MNSPPRIRVYFLTWAALLVLLASTYTIARIPLGTWNTIAGFGIAAAKAVLVALFFMHLRRAPALVIVFAVAALFALAILFGLSGTDYATRRVSPAPWTAPDGS